VREGAEAVVTWSSDDTDLATVDQQGIVTTLTPGTVQITAESEKKIRAVSTLRLCCPVESVVFKETEYSVNHGKALQLNATVTTTDGETYPNKLVAFSSSDESILTVDADGLVTAIALGSATVTAEGTGESSSVSASVTVRVICAVHSAVSDPAVAPTQKETGLTAGSHCKECGIILVARKIIPALDDMDVLWLPTDLKEIGEGAFAGLACQAVIVQDGCQLIGEKAFENCKNLLYIRIPASVTELAENAFSGCPDDVVLDHEQSADAGQG